MKLKFTLIYLLGFLSCAFLFLGFSYFDLAYAGIPIEVGKVPFGTGLISFDVTTPNDWISEDDIIIFDDMILLRIANATLSSYSDSGSMRPIFDEGANGIRIVPKNADEINVGDIVSYRFEGILVVHRVIEKGFDNDTYFIMKGDNNFVNDGKVRFEEIEYVTIGVIW